MNTRNSTSRVSSAVTASLSMIAVLMVALPARSNPNETAWRVSRPVRQEILEHGNEGAFRVPLAILVTSEAQWKSTMDDLEREGGLRVTPAPGAPRVNWGREAVVLVSMGESSSFHCTIENCEVRRIGSRTVCDVVIDVMPASRIQVITAPYYIIKIERRGDVTSFATRYQYRHLEFSASSPGLRQSDSRALAGAFGGGPTRDVSWGDLKVRFP